MNPGVQVQRPGDPFLPNQDRLRNYYLDYLVSVQGYVVHLVDFLDKQGDIRVNARTIEYLVRQIDDESPPNQFNFAFGYSMGGVITRYALLRLQQEGITHRTSAYVSLDAPHRGAFIPPSAQAATRTLSRMAGGGATQGIIGYQIRNQTRAAITTLDSAAARQLLGVYLSTGVPSRKCGWGTKTCGRFKTYHALIHTMLQDDHNLADPSFFDLREQMVDMGGYPQQTLNVGVSFGNASAALLRSPMDRPDGTILYWKIKTDAAAVATAQYTAPLNHPLCRVKVAGRSRGRSCAPFNLDGTAFEDVVIAPGSTTEIFKDIRQAIVGGNTGQEANNTQIGVGAYISSTDSLAGFGIMAAGAGWFAPYADDVGFVESEDTTTFIPTVSALDVSLPTIGTTITGATRSPFDNIQTSNIRSEHGEIPNQVAFNIETILDTRNASTMLRNRTDPNSEAGQNLSSYFATTGQFLALDYEQGESMDHLPVVRDGTSAAFSGQLQQIIDTVVATEVEIEAEEAVSDLFNYGTAGIVAAF